MRARLLIGLAVAVMALVAPGSAVAHGRHRHRGHLKGRAGHTTVHLGPNSGNGPHALENAGTVTSYTGGVLTLTLNGGSSVSGKVTNNTRIRCITTTATAGEQGDDHGNGDDNGNNNPGDNNPGQNDGFDMHGEHHSGFPGKSQSQGAGEPPCDSSALVSGAVVHIAKLRIDSMGSEFELIVLVR